jgi:hypothetical protein
MYSKDDARHSEGGEAEGMSYNYLKSRQNFPSLSQLLKNTWGKRCSGSTRATFQVLWL